MDMTKTMRQAIKRDGRSIYRLAKDAGIHVAVVQRFDNGERGITLDTASKLATALGLELKERR